jgi:hypothetical protein
VIDSKRRSRPSASIRGRLALGVLALSILAQAACVNTGRDGEPASTVPPPTSMSQGPSSTVPRIDGAVDDEAASPCAFLNAGEPTSEALLPLILGRRQLARLDVATGVGRVIRSLEEDATLTGVFVDDGSRMRASLDPAPGEVRLEDLLSGEIEAVGLPRFAGLQFRSSLRDLDIFSGQDIASGDPARHVVIARDRTSGVILWRYAPATPAQPVHDNNIPNVGRVRASPGGDYLLVTLFLPEGNAAWDVVLDSDGEVIVDQVTDPSTPRSVMHDPDDESLGWYDSTSALYMSEAVGFYTTAVPSLGRTKLQLPGTRGETVLTHPAGDAEHVLVLDAEGLGVIDAATGIRNPVIGPECEVWIGERAR